MADPAKNGSDGPTTVEPQKTPLTQPTKTSLSFEETFRGCGCLVLLLVLYGAELTAWPFLLGVVGCGCVGWLLGCSQFPGTGLEYVLAALGAFLGVFVGIALTGAALGALVGWLVGWGLWHAGKSCFGVEYDPVFWWPIYIGAGTSGAIGLVWAVVAAVNTGRWWRYRRTPAEVAQALEPFTKAGDEGRKAPTGTRRRQRLVIITGSAVVFILAALGLLLAVLSSPSDKFVKLSVPVVVSYRNSHVGVGKVAIFSNQTSNRLMIAVEVENSEANRRKAGTLDLEPNGKAEIGWLEGWVFESGKTITISHPSYGSKTITIP